MQPEQFLDEKQLCWECAKAYGACNWSEHFEPVPGWKAIPVNPRIRKDGSRKPESYKILKCPEFVEEKTHNLDPKEMDMKGCYDLVEAMIVQMRRDYLKCPEKGTSKVQQRKEIEQSIRVMYKNANFVIMHLRKEVAKREGMKLSF